MDEHSDDGGDMQPDGAERWQMERKHIVIVNRDPEFLGLMRELLQLQRYNVTTTNFVPRSYEQIAAAEPDLVIVDLSLRDEAAWNLLERLHEASETEQLPVIVVSSSPELLNEAEQDGSELAGERFLLKPLEIDRLLETINDLIGTA
jgi:DNA-binding response OmpR family regulator